MGPLPETTRSFRIYTKVVNRPKCAKGFQIGFNESAELMNMNK